MPLVVWGLDEVFEAVGAVHLLIIGLLIVLVLLERGLTADSPTRRFTRARPDPDASGPDASAGQQADGDS